jgi:mannose-6-phosphate isomerase-like protein (cupin superfamily)
MSKKVGQINPNPINPSFMGKWPCPPDKKKPMKAPKKDFIFPPNNPYMSDLNYLYVSNDKIHVGIFILPPGAKYEPPDVHAGDEVYYVLEGTLTELNPLTGTTQEVREGEAILLPKGAWHQGFNFEKRPLKILYVIAPNFWATEEGGGLKFPGEIKTFKWEGV